MLQVINGEDLICGLLNKDLGETIFIPSIMLKLNSDLFLDDKTIAEVSAELKLIFTFLMIQMILLIIFIGKSDTQKFSIILEDL